MFCGLPTRGWAIIGAAGVAVALILLVLILIVRGVPVSSQGVQSLISYIGILVGLLATLGGLVANADKLNGHLNEHMTRGDLPAHKPEES